MYSIVAVGAASEEIDSGAVIKRAFLKKYMNNISVYKM
jgi:hypothetical protein